jgi:hypothetical protein
LIAAPPWLIVYVTWSDVDELIAPPNWSRLNWSKTENVEDVPELLMFV